MTIGVLHEPSPETRVSLLPQHVGILCKAGHKVVVQNEAGLKSYYFDDAYKAAGARMGTRVEVVQLSDIILAINTQHEKEWQNKVFIGDYRPLFAIDKMKQFAIQNATIFSLDMLANLALAPKFDILSSQDKVAGYKAVLLAAQMLPRCFPLLTTVGNNSTLSSLNVLVIGAGVAGLQAIATAKGLGAMVEVFDKRPSVREEVENLGGNFIEIKGLIVGQLQELKESQLEGLSEKISKADVVITTETIAGKRAPLLIKRETIRKMKPGSVIVDLAASTGGNTELTENNKTVIYHFVSIVGDSHLYSTAPADASKMYGDKLLNFLESITGKDGAINLNFEDDLVKGTCITHSGRVFNEQVATLLNESV
jgi:NAD(P) transhydrogenase subunit alpha